MVEYRVVDDIPPVSRRGSSGKYLEILEAAKSRPGKAIVIDFEDTTIAHARGNAIRTFAKRNEDGDKFLVTVRQSEVYVRYNGEEAAEEKPKKKATKKTTARKKTTKKRPSARRS